MNEDRTSPVIPEDSDRVTDIRSARTRPAAWYRDTEGYRRETETLFARTWQWLDEIRDLPAGQVRAVNLLEGLLDEPLLIGKSESSETRVFSNVCTHRGHLLVEPGSCTDRLRCRYHGRRFHLDGRFQSAPGFEDAECFPSARDDLPAPHYAFVGSHALCSFQPVASFEETYGALLERVGFLPFAAMREDPLRRRDFLVQAHWALYVENYLEGLHIPYVHPRLSRVLDLDRYRCEELSWGTLQVAEAKSGEAHLVPPPESVDHGRKVAAYYFWVFPNLMWNFYPWGLSLNVVQPLGPRRSRILFRSYVHRSELLEQGASADLDQVEREDEEVVERVQKGIESRLYHSGRYSPQHERGVFHFHRLLERFSALDRGGSGREGAGGP